jgi:uncharacterized repeat protein (TIGR01451 family)
MKNNAQRSNLWRFLAGAALTFSLVMPALAQDVTLQALTNGQDANSPPGPVLTVGDPVAWTYVVTASGGRDLLNVVVTDDQGVTVTCPATSVLAGESMTCTASGTAVAGQYANIGTVDAELVNATLVTASDPSHYFGQAAPAVAIQTLTEGVDADTPTGPVLPVGAAVNWSYQVVNIGADPLTGVTVTDSAGVVVTCPVITLAAGESMTCTAAGTVQPGQYANTGTVVATLPDESVTVASDPSHHYGQTLLLETATNGQDADLPPGPSVLVGSAVAWTYTVTNPGPAAVTGLAVTDDQGVTVTCPVAALAAGESATCSAGGTAGAGPYANVGTATALLPMGGTVSASDPSHYLGQVLTIETATNGQDADTPPGPVLAVGAPVNWTYLVTNLDSVQVSAVAVTDSQGVAVTCPSTVIAGGASMTCSASGTAVAGQYQNIGEVEATHPTLGQVGAFDPSHYLGQDQVLDFGDAPDPTYPTALASVGASHVLGSGVHLGACVDSELDGQPGAAAEGDDAAVGLSTFGICTVAGDDDDGVSFTSFLVPGAAADVQVVASAACTLSAWIDFNADGDWSDAGESLFPGGVVLAPGANALSIPVPSNAVIGATMARFRCSTDGVLNPGGAASDGEVEDYRVELGQPLLAASKTAALAVDVNGNGFVDPGDTIGYTVVLANTGTLAATGVTFTDTPDASTALVNGLVTTSAGTVTVGNGAGDSSVTVDVGSLGAGGSVTISLQVVVANPLNPAVTQVLNQGLVSAAGVAGVSTDDPAVGGGADATVMAVRHADLVGVPALGPGGLGALALVLAFLAGHRLRRPG